MKKIYMMDLMSWEMTYDNALTDDQGKVLNLKYPMEWGMNQIVNRLPRFYIYKGDLYLAPEDSQCEPPATVEPPATDPTP